MKVSVIKFNALVLTFLAFSLFAQGEVKLPAIFGDNMVMQQQTDAAIWGSATAGSTVRITTSWNKRSYSARAGSDGKWKGSWIRIQSYKSRAWRLRPSGPGSAWDLLAESPGP